MPPRIAGLETEYGCLVSTSEPLHILLPRIRDWMFENDRYGLLDIHDRDWDEPAGNGGFLFNGGRVYIDMGHIEYCTPECLTVSDLVRYDRAGDALLQEAVRKLKLEDQVSFIRNNVDHYTGATFGCHENYSLTRKAPLTEDNVLSLLAFLTLRTLYCGAGRVGSVLSPQFRGQLAQREDGVTFQISQRADYIQNDFFEWVQHNRAIINTRDEPLADPRQHRRLHLIHGDTNVLPASLFLKAGTTRLVLDLLEEGNLPQFILADAVDTLRTMSRQLAPPWIAQLTEGARMDILEVLDTYRRRAEQSFRNRDDETNAILDLWKTVLEQLAGDRSGLVGIVDWVTKHTLLEQFRQQEGLDWHDPWMESQDLEFHHIRLDRSLGMALAQEQPAWAIHSMDRAMIDPPNNTRACVRSDLMRQLKESGCGYILDWDTVEIVAERRIHLRNPFACTPGQHQIESNGRHSSRGQQAK